MKMPAKNGRNLLISSGVVAAFVIGILGGSAAVAGVPSFLSSGTVTDDQGVVAVKPDPHYKKNAKGLTYGSSADALTPDSSPDLIAAVATNGREGYVRREDLDDANGTTAAKSFKSPEDALRWQASRDKSDKLLKVYDQEGKEVIGNFIVFGGVGAPN
jgi:hypothetical protein